MSTFTRVLVLDKKKRFISVLSILGSLKASIATARLIKICFFCPFQVIGNKWDLYLDLLQADYTEG